jgi:methylthioribose-1-phosphate isomerase
MKQKKLILTQPIEWIGDKVRLLDQTRLPTEETYLDINDYRDIVDAIKTMKVRGAPAIGVAGAYGLALGALQIRARSMSKFLEKLYPICLMLVGTRPTARNLFWAIERMEKVAHTGKDIQDIKRSLVDEAVKIHEEEVESTRKLSRNGARLIKDGMTILTHCNAGPLAAPGYGTALGIIIYAHQQGKKVRVFVDETRPLLQGARLTAWELKKAGVPFTLITDSMAGSFMKYGEIDCIIVGADRIARNGDTANKIGTYTLAVLAKEHGIPFYVAAPTSTIDLSLKSGDDIPIEQRKPEEITDIKGVQIAPDGIDVANPAFDITPYKYITAIVTEKGIIRKLHFSKVDTSS